MRHVRYAPGGSHRFASLLLIGCRALIGPWLLFDAIDGRISRGFVWVFAAGVLSDVLDGELLRHRYLSDPMCRRFDSWTDAVFYMSVFVCMWRVHPAVIRHYIVPITLLLATQWCSWTFCLVKLGGTTSYHSYLAKCWGLTLFLGTVNVFTVLQPALIVLPIAVGIASHIEDMVITAVLPAWQTDVTGIWAARRLQLKERAGMVLGEEGATEALS